MKRVLLVLIALIILIACSMKKNPIENFIVYPIDTDWVVEYMSSGQLHQYLIELPIFSQNEINDTGNSYFHFYYKDNKELQSLLYDKVTYSELGYIACINYDEVQITTYKLSDSSKYFIRKTLSLPTNYKAYTIELKENILFVGGQGEKEILGFYDLELKKPSWTEIEIPKELRHYGKSVDDLLIIDTYLIAVDNVILPKWILKYDISALSYPKLINIKELNPHGTYKNIVKACYLDNKYFLLSTNTTMFSVTEHISFLDSNFVEIDFISNKIKNADAKKHYYDVSEQYYSWNSINVISDLLLISSDNRGLGILDLSEIDFKGDWSKVVKDRIVYKKLKGLPDSKILNILTIPESDRLFIVLCTNGVLKTMEMSVQEIKKLLNESDDLSHK